MVLTLPALGVILILFGIALFIVDVSVTNHGLLTAGGILTLLAGGWRTSGRAFPTRACCSASSLSSRCSWGAHSQGWVFVHGERWRAVLAFVPEEADPQDGEPVVGAGRRVRVVGFGEGGVMQVVPIELPGRGRDLDRPGR
jgi:membrane-bound ClpP family serine protease